MRKSYVTSGPLQTKKLGASLAKTLLAHRPKKGAAVVGLRGDLGGGKTTFLQGFARGIGFKGRILSPTFIIIRRIKLDNRTAGQLSNFYHIDCYRLKGPQELVSLGFKKMIADSKNIVVVEWADRVRRIIPKNAVWVDFVFVDKNKRRITIEL